jgi:uncharacterized membrane protein YwzB
VSEETEDKENSNAIHAHLSIMQSIIQRMASNSASCKAWCITLVCAILVVVADKEKSQYSLIAIIPTVLFLVLDTYYLALERIYRQSYNTFIKKLHSKKISTSDLYVVVPSGSLFKTFFLSLLSLSIWLFYLTLIGMVLIARIFVI